MRSRSLLLAFLALAPVAALAQPNETFSRSSRTTTRTWFEAGTPVELHDVDRASGTVRVAMSDAQQTFVVEKNADAGFEALRGGFPVLLSWRFNRAARAEAVLRVLTDRGAVTMVARPVR